MRVPDRLARKSILVVVAASVCVSLQSSEKPGTQTCETVGVLSTAFGYRSRFAKQARVEIRRCKHNTGDLTLDILAWAQDSSKPELVIHTGDFGVVQSIGRDNVFVIETGGATTDQIYVIGYRNHRPRLLLRRVTRGTAEMSVAESSIGLLIKGIYAGDEPPRTERHTYQLDPK